MSPRQAQSDASINLAEFRNFLFCAIRLLNIGVTLSLIAEAWAGMMISLMSIRLSCVLVTAPRCSINHFEIRKAGPRQSQVIRCIGCNWIYLFIQSNNRMDFPGETRVLHFTEQSRRFTVRVHNYKHSNKIHTSERKRHSDLDVFVCNSAMFCD